MTLFDREFSLSTNMVDKTIRNDFWRDVSSIIYDVSAVEDEGAPELSGSVYSRPIGSLILGKTTFNRQICRRTPQSIVRSALDLYVVQFILAGDYRGDFNGTAVSARAGDIFILDLSQVLDSQKEPGARISLVLPRPMLERWAPRKHLHGMVFPGERATTRLIADYMLGIERVIGDLTPREIPAVEESLSILIASAVDGDRAGRGAAAVTLPLRQRILDYIDSRLDDPQLGPETILKRFRLSRSHLYRAFEEEGGVARLIREKRLDRAYDLLARAAGSPISVKEAAGRCGISPGADFSKLFKARFGISASEVRGLAMTAPRWSGTPLVLHGHLHDQATRQALDVTPSD